MLSDFPRRPDGLSLSRGRPKGARNKLATRVLQDLLQVWDEPVSEGSEVTKGLAALRVMAVEDPAGYAKLYASLLPREFTVEAVADLGDNDLDAMIEKLRDELLLEHKVKPEVLELKKPDYSNAD